MALSVTYNFSAGTAAVADEVDQNFSDITTNALDKRGDTMTGSLLFTDALYDIGASGATRPRDFFLSRNAVIGGTLGVTGALTGTSITLGTTLDSNALVLYNGGASNRYGWGVTTGGNLQAFVAVGGYHSFNGGGGINAAGTNEWLRVASTGITVASAATFGSGVVALIGSDGKINGPLSSTIIDNLSGANLTALNAAELGSGIIPDARMPNLTGDATTVEGAVAVTLANSGVSANTYGSGTLIPVLTVDAKGRITSATTSAAAFTGRILQMVQATYSTQTDNTTTTFADSGLTATITPSASSSKVIVCVSQAGCLAAGTAGNGVAIRLVRDGGTVALMASRLAYDNGTVTNSGHFAVTYLDNPATTSAVVYKTTFAAAINTDTARVQDSSNVSIMLLLEISQ